MPATPPPAVVSALELLAEDRAGLDDLYAHDATAAAALADAQNARTVAANALAGARTNFDADKAALITLIQTTFTSGPPAPAPAPEPVPTPATPDA